MKQFINENESYVLSLGGGTPCYAGNLDLILHDKNKSLFLPSVAVFQHSLKDYLKISLKDH